MNLYPLRWRDTDTYEPDYDDMVEAREDQETWDHHVKQAECGDVPEETNRWA